MNSSEQEAMMESDEDEQMDNGPQNGIDEDLDSSQGKVSNCFLTFLIVRYFSKISYTVWYTALPVNCSGLCISASTFINRF